MYQQRGEKIYLKKRLEKERGTTSGPRISEAVPPLSQLFTGKVSCGGMHTVFYGLGNQQKFRVYLFLLHYIVPI